MEVPGPIFAVSRNADQLVVLGGVLFHSHEEGPNDLSDIALREKCSILWCLAD
jgi:hypothetical protein